MKTSKILMWVSLIMGGNLFGQSVTINTQASSIAWEGGNVVGKMHNGAIQLQSGVLNLKSGNITGGEFIIDMMSMTNADLPEGVGNNLMGHLKSDDFFAVETHPTAKLVIKSATAFKNNQAKVSAVATIKGNSKPVSFDVTRKAGSYEGEFTIDRAEFDVRYGSGSFFDNLGDDAIQDEIKLIVKLETK